MTVELLRVGERRQERYFRHDRNLALIGSGRAQVSYPRIAKAMPRTPRNPVAL
jgi:hypothetical protein